MRFRNFLKKLLKHFENSPPQCRPQKVFPPIQISGYAHDTGFRACRCPKLVSPKPSLVLKICHSLNEKYGQEGINLLIADR